jgi:hypothetical protein
LPENHSIKNANLKGFCPSQLPQGNPFLTSPWEVLLGHEEGILRCFRDELLVLGSTAGDTMGGFTNKTEMFRIHDGEWLLIMINSG